MRRKMSALTTTILGAVVTASTVSAQQAPLPAAAQPPRRAAAGAPEPPDASDSDTLFGMTAMRGARYLLRNGLDYLNYQQYDRALKFLREAENRQKELNKAEKLSLKQGIERAQRGLREAADAEAPYALSDRSYHRNGFTTAKPGTQVAASADGVNKAAHGPSGPGQFVRLGSDNDEQGEPIRLASADLVSSERSAASDDKSLRSPGGASLAAAPRQLDLADAPAATASGASDPRVVDSSYRMPGPSIAGLVRSPRPAAQRQDEHVALAQASPATPHEAGGAADSPPEQLASLPRLASAAEPTPANSLEAQSPATTDVATIKTSQPNAPAPQLAAASPATVPIEPTAPSTALAAPAALPAPAPPAQSPVAQAAEPPAAATSSSAVIDLERIPVPPLASGASASADDSHRETDVAKTSSSSPAEAATPSDSGVAAPQPTALSEGNDLPPLPAVLGQTEPPDATLTATTVAGCVIRPGRGHARRRR